MERVNILEAIELAILKESTFVKSSALLLNTSHVFKSSLCLQNTFLINFRIPVGGTALHKHAL